MKKAFYINIVVNNKQVFNEKYNQPLFNTALIYARNRLTHRTKLSMIGVLPAFFVFFLCCGSGFVFTALTASGAALSLIGVLQDFSRLFVAASLTVLAATP